MSSLFRDSSASSSKSASPTPLGRGSKQSSRSKLFQDDDLEEENGEEVNDKLSVLGIDKPKPKQSSMFSIFKSADTPETSAPSSSDGNNNSISNSTSSGKGSLTPSSDVDKNKAAKKANLSIRLEDETRIVAGLQSAVKKQTTGSIYSVVVDVSKSGTLDIGVKDLADNILAVSLLKRKDDKPGAGEEAGIRLGDVIFGVNFIPLREGSKTLISIIKDNAEKKKKIIHIQGWRCHQLCSDTIPGYIFPRADEMIVHSYGLFRSKVFSEWERWNFIEITLGHMVEDLWMRSQNIQDHMDPMEQLKSPSPLIRARQMQVLDLERNILQAKGLRTALNVRIVHTKNREDTVIYVLRVEDVESGLHWVISKRYQDFYSLYEEVLDISSFVKDVEFPKKRLALRLSAKVIEGRILALEQFVRKALHTLTVYAPMDSSASEALRHLQSFLGVDKHMDCVHPPILDDQRIMEMMAYRFLNDYNSPACQQCVRFTTSVELDNMVESGEDGYRGLLTFLHDALAEVEQFVQQQHEQQMFQALTNRRPDWTTDQRNRLIRQCIRRQVESALFLPLRRTVFRILQTHLQSKIRKLHGAISILQQAKPSVFMVDSNVQRARSLPRAITAFRKCLLAYIPADQGQFLVEAAQSISELHSDCREMHEHSINASVLSRTTSLNSQRLSESDSFRHGFAGPPEELSRVLDLENSNNSTAGAMGKIQDAIAGMGGSSDRSNSPVNPNSHSGGLGAAKKNKRRPSLQERIKTFKEAEVNKVNNDTLSDDGNGNGDDDTSSVSSRVSFSVRSTSLTGFKRNDSYNRDQVMANLSTSQRAMMNLQDFESFLDTHSAGGAIVSGVISIRSPEIVKLTTSYTPPPRPKSITPSRSEDDPSESSSGNTKVRSSKSNVSTDNSFGKEESDSSKRRSRSKSVILERSKGDIDPLLRPPDDENFKLFEDVFDKHKPYYDHENEGTDNMEEAMIKNAISADDFLPLFTYVLVHSGIPQLYLIKELMVAVISNEDSYGECGYYLATLEAAVEHIIDLASQYEGIAVNDGFYDDGEDIFDYGDN